MKHGDARYNAIKILVYYYFGIVCTRSTYVLIPGKVYYTFVEDILILFYI